MGIIRSYTPEGFQVEVSSCDVEVLHGSRHEYKVEGLLPFVSERMTLNVHKQANFVKVVNTKSCNDQPMLNCDRLCKVSIYVPPNYPPSMLWIFQSNDDKADHVRVRVDTVVLSKLYVVGGNQYRTAGPTLELHMSASIVTESIKVKLDNGQALLSHCNLTGDVDIRSTNSVALMHMYRYDKLQVQWRQPVNQMCGTPALTYFPLPDPEGNFALCNSDLWMSWFQDYYDTSKDFFLDHNEFVAKLPDVPYCCGGSCPHDSNCNSKVLQLFPLQTSSDSGPSTASRYLVYPTPEVWNRLVAAGYSGMVPGCFRELQFVRPAIHPRVLSGWPRYKNVSTTTTVVPIIAMGAGIGAIKCTRNSDCITSFCSTDFRCAPNPAITYSFQYSWSECDRKCGGGQQAQTASCVGTDGRVYPTSLCGYNPTVFIASCNTQACVVPTTPPTLFSVQVDMDLRKEYIKITANVSLPEGATYLRAYLGTAKTMVDPIQASAHQDVCGVFNTSGRHCSLTVEAKLARYIDRIYYVGATSDGNGPEVTSVIVDRTALSTSYYKWKVASEAGLVWVHLYGGNNTWYPKDKLTGIRMYINDAKKLMREVGPRFGNPQSTEEALVVIDTVAVPGIPQTRWIYATRPVYLAMDTSHLNFFSAGLLTPTIFNYRVHLEDQSCDSLANPINFADFNNPDAQTVLIDMYEQIAKSLRSDGLAPGDKLRGTLSVVATNTRELSVTRDGNVAWIFKEHSDGNVTMSKRENELIDQYMISAAVLSLFVGGLCAILGTSALFRSLKIEVSEKEKERTRKTNLLADKLGSKVNDKHKWGWRWNPFLEPIVLINLLLCNPIRRRLVNSLQRFVIDLVEKLPPVPLPSIHRKDFPSSVTSPNGGKASRIVPSEILDTTIDSITGETFNENEDPEEAAQNLAVLAARTEVFDRSQALATERNLVGQRYRSQFAILDANNLLVQKGIAAAARTTLVKYTNELPERIDEKIRQQGRTEEGVISFSESSVAECCRYLRRVKHKGKSVKIVALNDANCSFVGGTYSEGGCGTGAQKEEELCRMYPGLFDSLKSCYEAGVVGTGTSALAEYKEHVFGARIGNGYAVARNVLFTEEVQCMRGSMDLSYRLLFHDENKVSCGFVEAGAPVFGRGHDLDFEFWKTDPVGWYEKVLLNVFWAAKSVDPSYDVIVVGPWGCGALGNDPRTVAQSFVNIIQKHNLSSLYKEIHFCLGRSPAARTTHKEAYDSTMGVFRDVICQSSLGSVIQDYTPDLQDRAARWTREETHKVVESKASQDLVRQETKRFSDMKRRNYVTMRDFRRRYEEYCLHEDLDPIMNRKDIIKHLTRQHDMRVIQESVWRIKGACWRQKPLPPGEVGANTHGGAGKHPIWLFSQTHLRVTGNVRTDYADMMDRYSAGQLVRGFARRYEKFCESKGIVKLDPLSSFDPNNAEGALQTYCRKVGLTYQELSILKIPNIRLQTKTNRRVWFKAVDFDLLFLLTVDLIVLLAPAVIMLNYAMYAQVVYAKTSTTQEAVTWLDVYGHPYPYLGYGATDKRMMCLAEVVIIWQITYMCLALLRVLVEFVPWQHTPRAPFSDEWFNRMGDNIPLTVKDILNLLFSLVLMLEIAFFFTWLGTIGAWAILAALLDPTKFLAQGVAVAAIVLVPLAIWREMSAAFAVVLSKVDKAVRERMQKVLRAIKERVANQMHEEAVHALSLRVRVMETKEKSAAPVVKFDDSLTDFDKYHALAYNTKEVTVSEIFNLLDRDHAGFLSKDEFKQLFTNSDVQMSEEEIYHLFYCCDLDGSGSITQEELEEGWEYIMQDCIKQEMRQIGASKLEIIIAICIAVLILLCLFTFIFIALAGWTGETSFKAVIQSILIGGGGKFTTMVRNPTPAEGDIDGFLKEVESGEHDDADGEEGGEEDGGVVGQAEQIGA
jgi:Ca2+-binding EF-hand superfamily protein